jgi:hypothetical protein
MKNPITNDELIAFLGETLSETRMIEIERAIREDEGLRARLEGLLSQRDSGAEGIGEIWKRFRLTCPTRETLGSFLFNVLSPEETQFIELHLSITNCVYCLSNLEDLKRNQAGVANQSSPRRQRYFQSSVGRLPKK